MESLRRVPEDALEQSSPGQEGGGEGGPGREEGGAPGPPGGTLHCTDNVAALYCTSPTSWTFASSMTTSERSPSDVENIYSCTALHLLVVGQ